MPERCVWPVLLGPFACHRAVGADLRAVVGGPGAGGISRCRSGCHLADDFLVGEALDVGEIDRDPELLGHPLLVGGQAHQPAPAWCPATRGWWTSHGIGITIACSFRWRGGPSAVTPVSWLSAALACPTAGPARRPPPQRCFPYLCWRHRGRESYAQPAHGLGAWPGSIADRPAPVTRFDWQVCWHR